MFTPCQKILRRVLTLLAILFIINKLFLELHRLSITPALYERKRYMSGSDKGAKIPRLSDHENSTKVKS